MIAIQPCMTRIDPLHTFYIAVVDHKSFTREAAELMGSRRRQSAKQISQLEDRLGTRLLHRTTLGDGNGSRPAVLRPVAARSSRRSTKRRPRSVRSKTQRPAGIRVLAQPFFRSQRTGAIPLFRTFQQGYPDVFIDLNACRRAWPAVARDAFGRVDSGWSAQRKNGSGSCLREIASAADDSVRVARVPLSDAAGRAGEADLVGHGIYRDHDAEPHRCAAPVEDARLRRQTTSWHGHAAAPGQPRVGIRHAAAVSSCAATSNAAGPISRLPDLQVAEPERSGSATPELRRQSAKTRAFVDLLSTTLAAPRARGLASSANAPRRRGSPRAPPSLVTPSCGSASNPSTPSCWIQRTRTRSVLRPDPLQTRNDPPEQQLRERLPTFELPPSDSMRPFAPSLHVPAEVFEDLGGRETVAHHDAGPVRRELAHGRRSVPASASSTRPFQIVHA